ncbi:GntR family transcriptional regulator [Micromonospora sp. WMMD708]|uniref:GntR family transcriptional regulator n=1 Tax=Micromonospora sp. WMMD708 TaxID=3403464 RepID=UPI003BF46E3F
MTIPMGYRKVAADLHARIQQGEYPPESRLPTYAELAQLYSASVSTVQRAVMLLQAHGIIIGISARAQRMRRATRQWETASSASHSPIRRARLAGTCQPGTRVSGQVTRGGDFRRGAGA